MPCFDGLNGDAPLEVIVGRGRVLSFKLEDIDGFVIGPIRIVSKRYYYLK
jgi:hypothetical protein